MSNEQERYTKILFLLMQMDEPENLRKIAVAANDLRADKMQRALRALGEGKFVQLTPEYSQRKLYGKIGKIIKVNKTRAKVRFDSKVWNVPMTMLMPADTPEGVEIES